MRRLLLLALAVVALAPAASGATTDPPPTDFDPVWSPDGTAIVYMRFGDGPRVVNPDGTHDRRLAGLPNEQYFAFSPDWSRIVFTYQIGEGPLVVMKPDGTDRRVLAKDARPHWPAVSPDGRTIAYWADDGLRLIGVDGSGARLIAPGSPAYRSPIAWSPDGKRLAFAGGVGGTPLQMADLAAGSVKPIYSVASTGPAWSPDSGRIAFFDESLPALVVAGGSGRQTYPIVRGHNERAPVWVDNGTLVYSDGKALRRLDLATGKARSIGPATTSLALFRSQLAFGWNGVCGNRTGIYGAPLAQPARSKRLTDDCHVYGTPGTDQLTASDTLYQIVDGRGGLDVIFGAGNPYALDAGGYADVLLGGGGNDSVRGGSLRDRIDGGPGADTLYGGLSADRIVGGPGRDHIYGEGGSDTIDARDGQRDVVDCGANLPGHRPREVDTAYVDRVDVVKRCERVVRR
jgi:hypothetical protein